MNALKNAADQIRKLWDTATTWQRICSAGMATIAIATVVGVGWWSSRPQYIPLVANLSPGEAAEVVSKLEAEGIRTEMNFAGTSVLVPRQDFGKARIAAGDVVAESPTGTDGFGSSLLPDPSTTRARLVQAKEKQLEQSLTNLKAISSADVHIAKPEWTPFARERSDVTASVVLGLRRGVPFTIQAANTIAATVAGSIEGLTQDNVTITDLNGRIWAGIGLGQGELTERVEYQRAKERELRHKAEELLTSSLGKGKAVVQVNAEIDFTRTNRTVEQYDADSQVKATEKIVSETTSAPKQNASGITGVRGNATAASQGKPDVNSKKEETETTYENGLTKDTTTIVGGGITRLTIAATVDLSSSESTISEQQIESVIKNAVGFNDTRGDAIEVIYAPLTPPTEGPALVDTIDKWEFFTQIVRHASLAIAAIVALVVCLLVLKNVRPTDKVEEESAFDVQRTRLLAELATQAKEHPDVVSHIVEAWMDLPAESGTESDPKTPPTARAA